jgi:hypothetical protein
MTRKTEGTGGLLASRGSRMNSTRFGRVPSKKRWARLGDAQRLSGWCQANSSCGRREAEGTSVQERPRFHEGARAPRGGRRSRGVSDPARHCHSQAGSPSPFGRLGSRSSAACRQRPAAKSRRADLRVDDEGCADLADWWKMVKSTRQGDAIVTQRLRELGGWGEYGFV